MIVDLEFLVLNHELEMTVDQIRPLKRLKADGVNLIFTVPTP